MKKIGQGRTAEVFDLENGRVVKLLLPGFPEKELQEELHCAQEVGQFDLPAPKCYGIVEMDGRKGLVYDLAAGESLRQHMLRTGEIEGDMARMAQAHRRILGCAYPGGKDIRKWLRWQTERSELLEDTLKKPARRVEKNDAYRQLMNMTGCAEAKEQLTAMLAAHRMSHIAESRSRTVKQPYFHAVFTGNPGCAKTTCARLYARALAQEGITKHDRFAELTRASLCGKYQGHTAQMVKEVFKQNKGGTIFIDEAYSLASDERDSFGAEAIDEIIVGLENDPGTVVIFAGYPEKMEQFLDANPGLRSRIRVRFCDYTADELLEISGKIAADSGFTITADAGEKLLGIFEKERQVRDFGNGRFCRSLVESAIRRKSVRLGVMDADDLSAYLDPARYSDEELFSLDGNCFTYSAAGEDRAARRIGFSG